MAVEEGLDTGGVYARAEVGIGPTSTADRRCAASWSTSARALLVDASATGSARPSRRWASRPTPTSSRPTSSLDWTGRRVQLIDRVVRVGGAWTTFRGRRLKVLGAAARRRAGSGRPPGELDGTVVATGDRAPLELVEVQPEGKGADAVAAWRNGARRPAGERLGEPADRPA